MVSQQLTDIENYSVWSRSLRIAFLANNKIDFLDGDFCKEDFEESLHPQWDHCNMIALSWILNTVSKELFTRIIFASSAALLWKDLKERYDKVDGLRVFFLHREIAIMV